MTDDSANGTNETLGDDEARAAESQRAQERLDDLEARAGADFLHDRPDAESEHVYRDDPAQPVGPADVTDADGAG